ncbi:MAG: hypothetical protein ACXVJG_18370 [Mucilaginibacter sp.]
MDWKSFLIGTGLLIGAYLMHKLDKWTDVKSVDDGDEDYYNLQTIKSWTAIIVFIFAGIFFIISSLPSII